jgi:hypothetical protein
VSIDKQPEPLIHPFADLWREGRDEFTTPNIYRQPAADQVEFVSQNFRQLKMDREYVLFYRFEGRLYFPVWFEFRSINNNLLFLFNELKVDSFKDLKEILQSSFSKEEKMNLEVLPLVCELDKMPSFCVELKNFKIP